MTRLRTVVKFFDVYLLVLGLRVHSKAKQVRVINVVCRLVFLAFVYCILFDAFIRIRSFDLYKINFFALPLVIALSYH